MKSGLFGNSNEPLENLCGGINIYRSCSKIEKKNNLAEITWALASLTKQ